MLALAVALGVVVATAGPAAAHPLGNVSVNHYAGLVVGAERMEIDYVLDLAELPTVRARQAVDTDGDGAIGPVERAAYERDRCTELAEGLDLTVDGRAVAIDATGGVLRFLDGTAGLRTLRLECELRADATITDDGTAIQLRNTNPDARGWREISAVGDEVTLERSTVPETSVTERLRTYPDGAPTLDVTSAELLASPGGAPAPAIGGIPFGDSALAATDRFTALVASDDITIPLVVTSLVVAMVFGALHSLAPGHGKSLIAAYLLGQQRDRRLAFMLGGTVALTHTASVLAFGGVLSLAQSAAPEAFYPLFGVVSGLLFVALGAALLRQVRSRRRVGSHDHAHHGHEHAGLAHHGLAPTHDHQHHDHDHHDHDHDHHDHDHHDHDHHDHDHGDGGWHGHRHVDLDAVADGDLGWRGVVLPGLAGGLVPSPSALLVFLGGLALGRAWFGIALVLGYGVGIAATLVTAGWLLARTGDRLRGGGALDRTPRLARLAAHLPVVTAVLVMAGGVHVAVRAVI